MTDKGLTPEQERHVLQVRMLMGDLLREKRKLSAGGASSDQSSAIIQMSTSTIMRSMQTWLESPDCEKLFTFLFDYKPKLERLDCEEITIHLRRSTVTTHTNSLPRQTLTQFLFAATKSDRESALLWGVLGETLSYNRITDHETQRKALQSFQNAMEINPAIPFVLRQYARCCNRLRDCARAEQLLAKLIKIEGANQNNLTLLKNVYFQWGWYDLGMACLEQAIILEPGNEYAASQHNTALQELEKLKIEYSPNASKWNVVEQRLEVARTIDFIPPDHPYNLEYQEASARLEP